MQPGGQLSDLTDPLFLLRNRRPDKLLKLSVEDRNGVTAATLGGKLPDSGDGGGGVVTPELVLDAERQDVWLKPGLV